MWFYVSAQDKREGPITSERVVMLLRTGEISRSTLLWKEGMANWQELSALVSEYFPGAETNQEITSPSVSVQKDVLASRGSDRLDEFIKFCSDPVGRLAPLCKALGNGGAFGLGVIFGTLFDLALLLGVFLAAGNPDQAPKAFHLGDLASLRVFDALKDAPTSSKLLFILKLVGLAFLPLLSLAGAITVVRVVTGGRGRLGYDVLVSGCALLPLGLVWPIAVLLGPGNIEVAAFLYLMSLCLTILILNSGFTRVVKLSDRAAVLAIPATLLLNIWLWKVVVSAMLFN
jgi:hypothetical protein